MVLLGENGEDLQALLNIVAQEGEKLRVTFNIKKSKIMIMGQIHGDERWYLGQEDIREEVDRKLEEVDDYKYLGVTLRGTGNCFTKQAQNMENKAKQVAGGIKKMARGSCNMAFVGRIAWETLARPAIIYGCEIIHLREKDTEKLEIIQRDIARTLLGVPPKTSGVAVLGEMGWWSLKDHMAQRKLGYLGRLMFAKEEQWCRIAWIEGYQELDCRTQWWKDIQTLMEEYGIEMEKEVQTEQQWKKYIKNSMEKIIQERWKKNMEEKTSLQYYKYRDSMGATEYHKGDWESKMLAKARCGQLEVG